MTSQIDYSNSMSVQWLKSVRKVWVSGDERSPRGMDTSEILSSKISIDMDQSILCIPERELGTGFLCYEPFWILSGDNQLSTIKAYAPAMQRFSDEGVFLSGAYGPKIVDQLPYIIECLKRDQESRQAIINIWREKPGDTKDCPCTCLYQFFIRDNLLHMGVYMRSNDLYLGTPYDVFTQAMVAYSLCILLKPAYPDLKMGKLTLTVGSMHIYYINTVQIIGIIDKYVNTEGEVYYDSLEKANIKKIDFDYSLEFDDLKSYLHDCANSLCNGLEINQGFLKGLQPKNSPHGVFKR